MFYLKFWTKYQMLCKDENQNISIDKEFKDKKLIELYLI